MRLRDVPIKRKLVIVLMLISVSALVLSGGAFTGYEVFSFRKNLLLNLQTLAQITAAQTSTSLVFDDDKVADDILSKLNAEPAILQAAVYDGDGKLFSHYPAGASETLFPACTAPSEHFTKGSLDIFAPVSSKHGVIGTLYLKWDLSPAYARFRLYGLVMVGVFLCAVLVSLLLSSWLQARISQPILDLAETARAVSEKRDYLVRAKASGQDELGVLTAAFNHMLGQIHERDAVLQKKQEELQAALDVAKKAGDDVRILNAELENRVQHRTAELQSANHELEAFTYSVSHDLRSPLRHIDAFAQILEEEHSKGLDQDALKCIDRIRKGVQNMGQLVDDLLNLSRVGRAELQKESTPLLPLVQESITDLKPETKNRDIEWRVGALPVVECDPGLVKQIFINLLSNAIKYSRPRSKALIEVGETQVDGRSALFVRDNGVGFNMKYSNKLFGVFQRLHRPEEFEGTGVGLATVQRIIQLHGGRIWAEAELDKGATFFFTLGESVPTKEKT